MRLIVLTALLPFRREIDDSYSIFVLTKWFFPSFPTTVFVSTIVNLIVVGPLMFLPLSSSFDVTMRFAIFFAAFEASVSRTLPCLSTCATDLPLILLNLINGCVNVYIFSDAFFFLPPVKKSLILDIYNITLDKNY